MARTIEIIDLETQKRYSRQRKALVACILLSLGLFSYPVLRTFKTKWQTLNVARDFALYLMKMRTRAAMNKTPIEVRFRFPNLVEVYQVSSCGPSAERSKLEERLVSNDFGKIEFVPEAWVRSHTISREPILKRYCYDPLFGSSLLADGLMHGAVFLAHREDIDSGQGEHSVQVLIEGSSGNVILE